MGSNSDRKKQDQFKESQSNPFVCCYGSQTTAGLSDANIIFLFFNQFLNTCEYIANVYIVRLILYPAQSIEENELHQRKS
jgi:hypothetical protein